MKKYLITAVIAQSILLIGLSCYGDDHLLADKKSALNTLVSYKKALAKKNLSQMENVVVSDLVVIEGTQTNTSWADYRDNHIGPEMKEWDLFDTLETKNVKQFFSSDISVISEESIYRIKTKSEDTKLKAIETFTLVKKNGQWRIALIHFSGKPIK